jgi:hypothetical protein
MAAKSFLRSVAGRLVHIAGVVVSAGAGNDGDIPALDANGRLDPSLLPDPDGDKGDITVTDDGDTWTIDDDVISAAARGVLSESTLEDMRIALGAAKIDLQVFPASGTWTKPVGALITAAMIISGGGAGGGGRMGAASTIRGGGGGGGSSAVEFRLWPSAVLGQTQAVTVGAGGTCTAITGTANGNVGGNGGDSSFAGVTADHGDGGAAGTTAVSGAAGAAGSSTATLSTIGWSFAGVAGGAGSHTATATTGVSAPANSPVGGGGGGGGGVDAANTARLGAPGGAGGAFPGGLIAGGVSAGDQVVNGNPGTGISGPTEWLEDCVVATTGNVNTSNGLEAGDTIDGVVLATGDRVLVWQQTTESNNGIYEASASGAASRAADYGTAQYNDYTLAVRVRLGSTHADSEFYNVPQISDPSNSNGTGNQGRNFLKGPLSIRGGGGGGGAGGDCTDAALWTGGEGGMFGSGGGGGSGGGTTSTGSRGGNAGGGVVVVITLCKEG